MRAQKNFPHAPYFKSRASLEPRLSFVGGGGGGRRAWYTLSAHTSVNFSVKMSGYYQRTRGLDTYTAMSSENTETKIKPREEPTNRWFSKD